MSERKLPITFHGGYQLSIGEFKPDSSPRSDFGASLIENRFTFGADIPVYQDPKFRGDIDMTVFGGNDSMDNSAWGSHRYQFGLSFGYAQKIYNIFSARAKLGLAINQNYINDGGGEKPEPQANASILAQFQLGAKLCVGKSPFCFEPYVGVGLERSLTDPGYSIEHYTIGIQFVGHGDWVDGAEYRELEQDKKDSEAAAAKIIRELKEQILIAQRELDQIRAASKNTYLRNGVLSYVLKLPEGFADNESDYLKEYESDSPIVQELADNIASPYRDSDYFINLHAFSTFKHGSSGDNQVACYRFLRAVKAILVSQGIPQDRILMDARLGTSMEYGRYAYGASVHGTSEGPFSSDLEDLKNGAGQDAVMFELMSVNESSKDYEPAQKHYEKRVAIENAYSELYMELDVSKKALDSTKATIYAIRKEVVKIGSPLSEEQKKDLSLEADQLDAQLPELEKNIQDIQNKIDSFVEDHPELKDKKGNVLDIPPYEEEANL